LNVTIGTSPASGATRWLVSRSSTSVDSPFGSIVMSLIENGDRYGTIA